MTKKKITALTLIMALVLALVLAVRNLNVQAEDTDVKIEKFSAELVSGATRENGQYAWKAIHDDKEHTFVYHIDYALSGTGDLAPETVKFTLPEHIVKDRNGNYADNIIMPVPKEGEDTKSEFVYKDNGNGTITIYNAKSITAAKTGTIEIGYKIKTDPVVRKNKPGNNEGYMQETPNWYEFKDMEPSDSFDVTLDAGNQTDSASAGTVAVNTSAGINSANYSLQNGEADVVTYKDWASVVRDVDNAVTPSNADDYNYLVFNLNINVTNVTQGYRYKLDTTVTGADAEVVGYITHTTPKDNTDKIYKRYYSADGVINWDDFNGSKIQTKSTPDESVEVIVRYPKAKYHDGNEYEVHPVTNVTFTPEDGVDEPETVSGDVIYYLNRWQGPTGENFSLESLGDVIEDNGKISDMIAYYNPKYYYQYNFETKDGKEGDGRDHYEEIKEYPLSYDLTSFKTDRIPIDLKYQNVYNGNYYAATLDGSSFHKEDYGKKDFTFGGKNDTLKIKGTKLDDADYEYKTVSAMFTFYKPDITEDGVNSQYVNRYEYTDNDTVDYYGKFKGEWIKVATFSLKNRTFTNVNYEYVKHTGKDTVHRGFNADNTGKRIPATQTTYTVDFITGCKGYKLLATNRYYGGEMDVDASIRLNPTDNVINLMGNDKPVKVENNATIEGYLANGTQIGQDTPARPEESGYDYIADNFKTSEMKVKGSDPENNTANQDYAVNWSVDAREYERNSSGKTVQNQPSGTYFIKLPSGATYSDLKIAGLTDGADYTVKTSTKDGYMLAVQITKPGNYTINFKTHSSYDALQDFGRALKMETWYETGNDKIAEGSVNKTLDPDNENARFISGSYTYDVDALLVSSTGLTGKIAANDGTFGSSADVKNGSAYTYRIRLANDENSKMSDVVLFDSLENYDKKTSDWHGTLEDVNLSGIEAVGIKPVVYYSSVEGLDIANNHDLTDTSVWSKDKPENVTAIAIDCSKDKDGKPVSVNASTGIETDLYMRAPKSDNGTSITSAYNNVYASVTDGGSQSLIHQDFTTANLKVYGDVLLQKVNGETSDFVTSDGFTWTLNGTSDYGDTIDMTQEASTQGTASFEAPKGTYTLRETKKSRKYELNAKDYTVKIGNAGEVSIEGLDKNGKEFLFPNTPKHVADLSIQKVNSKTNDNVYDGVFRFSLSGSEADGDTLLLNETTEGGGATFRDIPEGTYTLSEVEALSANYTLNTTTYAVTVDNDGNLTVNGLTKNDNGDYQFPNDPLYPVTIKKVDASDMSPLTASFMVDHENQFNTDENGLVTMMLSSGQHTLNELDNPTGYAIDDKEYTINISDSGNVTINGLGRDSDGWIFPNTKAVKFTVQKVDATTHDPLGGAFLSLQSMSDGSTAQNNVNSDRGEWTFTAKPGSYRLMEYVAPDGYEKISQPYTVIVNSDGTVTINGLSKNAAGQFMLPNEKETPSVYIKTVNSAGNPLSNMNFDIGNGQYHINTSQYWQVSMGSAKVKPGTYTVDMSGKYGYKTMKNMSLEVTDTSATLRDAEGNVISTTDKLEKPKTDSYGGHDNYGPEGYVLTVKVEDATKRPYQFEVRDKDTGEPINKYSIDISDYDMWFEDEWTYDGTPHTEELAPTTFDVSVYDLPKGYENTIEDIAAEFTVAEDGTLSTKDTDYSKAENVKFDGNLITIYVSVSKSSFALAKADEDGNPLGGATFRVHGKTDAGIPFETTGTSAADGGTLLNDIPMGADFTVEETKAPDGYKKSDKKWTYNNTRTVTKVYPTVAENEDTDEKKEADYNKYTITSTNIHFDTTGYNWPFKYAKDVDDNYRQQNYETGHTQIKKVTIPGATQIKVKITRAATEDGDKDFLAVFPGWVGEPSKGQLSDAVARAGGDKGTGEYTVEGDSVIFWLYSEETDNEVQTGYNGIAAYVEEYTSETKTFSDGDTTTDLFTDTPTIVNEKSKNHTVTLKNDVKGDLGDTENAFDYTVHFEDLTGEATIDGKTVTGDTTVSLKDGQSIEMNIPNGTKYTISEKTKGHTATYTAKSGDTTISSGGSTTDTLGDNVDSVTFTNTKDLGTQTGINNKAFPWLFNIVLVGALLIIYRKIRD